MHRICGEMREDKKIADLSVLWESSDPFVWEKVFPEDRVTALNGLAALSTQWAVVADRDESWLNSSFRYTSTSGESLEAVRSHRLLHVFNHVKDITFVKFGSNLQHRAGHASSQSGLVGVDSAST